MADNWLLIPADPTQPVRVFEDYSFLAEMDHRTDGYNSRATFVARTMDPDDHKVRYGDRVFLDQDGEAEAAAYKLGIELNWPDGYAIQLEWRVV